MFTFQSVQLSLSGCVFSCGPGKDGATALHSDVDRRTHFCDDQLLSPKLLQLGRLSGSFVHVVFEKSFFDPPVWKLHDSYPMLDALLPLALVDRSVHPVHLAIPCPLIVLIVALIYVSTLPGERAQSVLFVVLVATFKRVAACCISFLAPFALPVF